jgi:hypothetical protein
MRKIQYGILFCEPSPEFGGTVLSLKGPLIRRPIRDLNRLELSLNPTSTKLL